MTLDDKALFDGQQLEIEVDSFHRDSIERAVPGLDGLLSIDLGARGRKITQKGVLHAASRSGMDEKVSEISGYMDGETHTLAVDGKEFGGVRMDDFKSGQVRAAGGLVTADYEIIYRQLEGA